MLLSGMNSSWWPLTSSITQGSILGLILLNTFLNELDDKANHTLRMFADDTKLGGLGHTLEGSAIIQRDLDRLGKWDDRYFVKFNKENYQVLYLGNHNPRQLLGTTQLQKNLTENDPDFPVDTKFYRNQQHTPLLEKANSILGCIRRSIAIRLRGMILPIYWRGLARRTVSSSGVPSTRHRWSYGDLDLVIPSNLRFSLIL